MSLDKLSEREQRVFLSIVQSFVATAEPVGSRYLAKKFELNLSPSSIRNVMNDLEEMGLVEQPHTSAGRIPTNSGFREYVNNLGIAPELNFAEKKSIVQRLSMVSQDVDLISDRASQVLSDISSQLGIVLSPRFDNGIVDRIDLVQISENRILFVLEIRSGLAKSVMVEIEDDIPGGLLEATVRLLNERLCGLTVQELKLSMIERFSDIEKDSREIIKMIGKRAIGVVNSDSLKSFHLAGIKDVMSHPEFGTTDRVGTILELIDRKDLLVRVLSDNQQEGVSIIIGEENQESLMKHCSVITTTYKYRDAVGTIGVIGPTRMEYDKVIALVQFMADTLSYIMMESNRS